MVAIKDFHHFKGDGLSRSERIQRIVYEMIVGSELPDDKRENATKSLKDWDVVEVDAKAGTVRKIRL